MAILFIASGILLLWLGGEALVRYATHLAAALGLSPLTIGLTVVAFATSAPELFASLVAATRGAPDMAFGNVVGSNIANIGLILGLSGMVVSLTSEARFLKRELPFMIGVGALMFWLVWDGEVSRTDGSLLLALLALYLWVLMRSEPSKEMAEEIEAIEGEGASIPVSLAGVALGVLLLVGGARLMIEGAQILARAFGISDRVIGLTLVAFGTSLPELASCLVAASRRAHDLILGNIVGSNIMNVLIVLAATAMVTPVPVERDDVLVDLTVMLGLSVVIVPFLAIGMRMRKREAIALVAVYLLYVASLF